MSALGHKRTFSDIPIYVRSWGLSGHWKGVYSMPLREGALTVKLRFSQLFPASEIEVLRRLHGSPLCLGGVWGSV